MSDTEDKTTLKSNDENSEKNPIYSEIKNKIDQISKTRRIRIEFTDRLTTYDLKWKFIFFGINIEAVTFVLLSLTNTIETIEIWNLNIPFDLLSGIFTIYVILLQYYINGLNYNERALQVHYHQLELEDLKSQLNLLLLKMKNKDTSEKEIIEKYEQIVNQYQLALKNNENHRKIDFERRKFDEKMYEYEKELKEYEDKSKRSKNEITTKEPEKPEGKRKKDFTFDIVLIYANMILTIIMFLLIFYVVLF